MPGRGGGIGMPEGGGGGAGRQESYATGKALARDGTKILL